MTIEDREIKVHELYSPSAPIKTENIFRGRKEQLNKIHEAVIEKGQHIAIFGERGVGKTSLANIVEGRYRGAISVKVTCNNASTLAGLWKQIFKRVPIGYEFDKKRQIGFQINERTEKVVKNIVTVSDIINPDQKIDIDDITAYLELLTKIDRN